MLEVRCITPSPRNSSPIFTKTRHFKVEDNSTGSGEKSPKTLIQSALEVETQHPGRTVLLGNFAVLNFT